MVNTEDFIKRLEIILDYYSLNASGFADKIGVQRSSLSHLLSGRNKPSLDFILKILEVFPDVDLYWILNGKGNFPKNEEATPEKLAPATPTVTADKNDTENLFSENEKEKSNTPVTEIETAAIANSFPITNREKNEIEKIVIFYKNGTFKSYVP